MQAYSIQIIPLNRFFFLIVRHFYIRSVQSKKANGKVENVEYQERESEREREKEKSRSKALYSFQIHDTLYLYDRIKHLRCVLNEVNAVSTGSVYKNHPVWREKREREWNEEIKKNGKWQEMCAISCTNARKLGLCGAFYLHIRKRIAD